MVVFFFKQKTAYEMRISDWSSDVCSSDLITVFLEQGPAWRERLQYAGHLAAHWQAHLVAVFVVDALEFHPYGSSAIGGGLTEMLHNHMASTQAAEAEIRAAFAAMSSRLGLNGGWYR